MSIHPKLSKKIDIYFFHQKIKSSTRKIDNSFLQLSGGTCALCVQSEEARRADMVFTPASMFSKRGIDGGSHVNFLSFVVRHSPLCLRIEYLHASMHEASKRR